MTPRGVEAYIAQHGLYQCEVMAPDASSEL